MFCRISIHAAREGGDIIEPIEGYCYRISIHAAREGGDLAGKRFVTMAESFQSTPPVKAATLYLCPSRSACRFQSTPPVKAATQAWGLPPCCRLHFNPRRP